MASNTAHPVSDAIDYRSLAVAAATNRPVPQAQVTESGEPVVRSLYPFTADGLATQVRNHPLYAQIVADIDAQAEAQEFFVASIGETHTIKSSAEMVQEFTTLRNDAREDLRIYAETETHPELKGLSTEAIEAKVAEWRALASLTEVIDEVAETWRALGLDSRRTKEGFWFWGRLSTLVSKYTKRG